MTYAALPTVESVNPALVAMAFMVSETETVTEDVYWVLPAAQTPGDEDAGVAPLVVKQIVAPAVEVEMVTDCAGP